MGLNSGGEGLQSTDFKLSLRGMQGITERNSLNWLFGISGMVFGLSSCVSLHRYWDRLIGYRLIGQHPLVSVSDVLSPVWPIINCACAKLIIATC